MRRVSQDTTRHWRAQAKTGDQMPVVRATIQKANLQQFDYDTALAPGGDFTYDRHRKGTFTSMIFGDPSDPREIRNIKSITWSRSVDQDVATCTLTILNTDITPIGNAEETQSDEDFDLPGWFTFSRGEGVNPWGLKGDTGWTDFYVPDRLVKTYEGYGMNPDVWPALDENLHQSGTWLIDKVSYSADGEIVLEMRDVGRLLLDQIVFPPVVPYAEYPLEWERIHSQNVEGRDAKGGSWRNIDGSATSSNTYYIGKGLKDPPFRHYVDAKGGVQGHYPKHALRDDNGKYWLSTGQVSARSKVWWQANLDNPVNLAAVRINPHGGPYRIYISLKTRDGWIGKKKIPYTVTTEGVNVHAGIPFVETLIADRHKPFDVILRRKYRGVTAVRLTFGRLEDTRVGNYPWRAALDWVKLYTGPYDSLSFGKGSYLKVVGNYSDYTAIVKWVCAWAGWYWPPHRTKKDFVQESPQTPPRWVTYAHADPTLPSGRVWGDFMRSGTTGETKLTPDLFDKKPLMDVINYVRDALGFLFFIDETGGAIWRMPNLWKAGNYLSPGDLGQEVRPRTTEFVTIDDEVTLLDYTTTLDSSNLRERVFVADVNGRTGVVIHGFKPTFSGHGLRRIAGWTDQRFRNKGECRVMADMVAARQMFTYRRGKVTIPGYPAIQVDDQIRIFERVTNETYYHYVLGITSTLNMEDGSWTYDVDTHWLGENREDAWVVKVDQLDKVTKAYLNALG